VTYHIRHFQTPKNKQKLMVKNDGDRDNPLIEKYVRDCLNGDYDQQFCNKLDDGSCKRLLGVNNGHCYLFELEPNARTGKLSDYQTAFAEIYPCNCWPWALVSSVGHHSS
jgi:hypothetical protein